MTQLVCVIDLGVTYHWNQDVRDSIKKGFDLKLKQVFITGENKHSIHQCPCLGFPFHVSCDNKYIDKVSSRRLELLLCISRPKFASNHSSVKATISVKKSKNKLKRTKIHVFNVNHPSYNYSGELWQLW